MKNYIFFFLICTATLLTSAQDVVQTRVYSYRSLTFIDKDYETIGTQNSQNVIGIIAFSEAFGRDYITVTVGEDVAFNGEVKSQKINPIENNEKTVVYLFSTEFQGYQVPLQLFETYDLSESSIVPSYYLLTIHNRQTGEYVQGQVFKGISRIK